MSEIESRKVWWEVLFDLYSKNILKVFPKKVILLIEYIDTPSMFLYDKSSKLLESQNAEL